MHEIAKHGQISVPLVSHPLVICQSVLGDFGTESPLVD